MTHKGHKRPKGKERNDMQAWAGHKPMSIDGQEEPKKKRKKKKVKY